QIHDERAKFEVGDGQALKFPDGSFDACLAPLVIQFIPDRARQTVHSNAPRVVATTADESARWLLLTAVPGEMAHEIAKGRNEVARLVART
ncbi:MAG: methyltransferase domain-containing protein, partial [Chloroflexi bacterium]|nr:methyltransferase domain-containing protein [Chloroflexota bacterium]